MGIIINEIYKPQLDKKFKVIESECLLEKKSFVFFYNLYLFIQKRRKCKKKTIDSCLDVYIYILSYRLLCENKG